MSSIEDTLKPNWLATTFTNLLLNMRYQEWATLHFALIQKTVSIESEIGQAIQGWTDNYNRTHSKRIIAHIQLLSQMMPRKAQHRRRLSDELMIERERKFRLKVIRDDDDKEEE